MPFLLLVAWKGCAQLPRPGPKGVSSLTGQTLTSELPETLQSFYAGAPRLQAFPWAVTILRQVCLCIPGARLPAAVLQTQRSKGTGNERQEPGWQDSAFK